MEPLKEPLRLISQKFIKQGSLKLNAKPRVKPVLQTWLSPTLDRKGYIKPQFQRMVRALNNLDRSVADLKLFRNALKLGEVNVAKTIWQGLLANVSESVSEAVPKGDASPNAKSTPALLSDASLTRGSLGQTPPLFVNSLNDISRHACHSPEITYALVAPTGSSMDPYVLGYVLAKIGSRNSDLAIKILQNPGWTRNDLHIGITAMLFAVQADPEILLDMLDAQVIPRGYHLPGFVVIKLGAHSGDMRILAKAFKQLLEGGMLPARSSSMGLLLRKVYSSSEEGKAAIVSSVGQLLFPHTFYPFLVRRLCESAQLGDAQAKTQLDYLFDHDIAEMATEHPSLVLHMLVLRIIFTDGVQATSPVLNRWVETDADGVSEPTWLLLFQAFRRIGRPDKCASVLSRALQSYQKLSLPFVGEYLMYTAQFHNLHEYLARLVVVLPEMQPVLQILGIDVYATTNVPRDEDDRPLQPLPHQLSTENRDFAVNRIHESWLSITYQAVLANVESMDVALGLYEKYINYVSSTSKNPATTLGVTDQFVALISGLQDADLGVAERVFRNSLEKLRIKRAPVDGKNYNKSLELLCYKYVQSGDVERAVRLVVDCVSSYGLIVKKTTFEPWIGKVPVHIQKNLLDWLNEHAGIVLTPVKQAGPHQHQRQDAKMLDGPSERITV